MGMVMLLMKTLMVMGKTDIIIINDIYGLGPIIYHW